MRNGALKQQVQTATTQISLSKIANLSFHFLYEASLKVSTFFVILLRKTSFFTFASMGDEAISQRGLLLEVRICTHRSKFFPSTVDILKGEENIETVRF